MLLHEARMMQIVSQGPPHPNIIGYHGCRVQRGRTTGLVLDKGGEELQKHIQDGKPLDKEAFMTALESAVRHLHDDLGLAHNDINYHNILVSQDGMPVLIDFCSCCKHGVEMPLSEGTEGWFHHADPVHFGGMKRDLYALERVRHFVYTGKKPEQPEETIGSDSPDASMSIV
ncbi:kinase-like domain-containing protein [Bombardia bombarda]|uniref:Kinase-like domain-containing protein n=1 Tax=Bombardia bombarda TaxID=252184 RepID=A0AA39U1Y0_9PEZI|nr:kinase-like domain-containing protein [Bombardia bombarda]